MDEVNDGSNVRGVDASSGKWRGGRCVDEVGGCAGGEDFGDALAVAVTEEHGSAGLGETGDLLLDGLLETLVVGLEG